MTTRWHTITLLSGYPYDWARVHATIVSAGGVIATTNAVEEPAWMGKARAVHAELSLQQEQGQQHKQEEQPPSAARPASASSTASGASASGAAVAQLRVGTAKVWGALKAEYPEGPPALPEYWQVALLVAHLEREAATAAAVAAGCGEEGDGKEAAAEAEAEG